MRKKLIKSSVIRVKKAGVVIIPQIAIWMFFVARYGIVGNFFFAPFLCPLAQSNAPSKRLARAGQGIVQGIRLVFSISV